jgi:hypothetical protein
MIGLPSCLPANNSRRCLAHLQCAQSPTISIVSFGTEELVHYERFQQAAGLAFVFSRHPQLQHQWWIHCDVRLLRLTKHKTTTETCYANEAHWFMNQLDHMFFSFLKYKS